MAAISPDELAQFEARTLRAIDAYGEQVREALAASDEIRQSAIKSALDGVKDALARQEADVFRAMWQRTWIVLGGTTVIMAVAMAVMLWAGGAFD